MTSMLRPLRIAVSVVSGLGCMLVIVFWIRSYWSLDVVWNGRTDAIELSSYQGRLYYYDGPAFISLELRWQYTSTAIDDSLTGYHFQPAAFSPMPAYRSYSLSYAVVLAAMLYGSVAVWLPWRYSLRTLLLVTTAVAILLGLIIYATRG